MSPNLPNPTGEPFDPRSSKEVKERFGERVADQWFAASAGRRRALIKQLLALEAHREKREKEELEHLVIEIDEDELEKAEDARRAEDRKATFVLHPAADREQTVAILAKNRDRYLAETVQKRALLRNPDAPHAGRLREDLARRRMQIHAIDMLLDGALSYEPLRAMVRADALCAGLSEVGLEYEYAELIERLVIKRIVRKAPAAPPTNP